MDNTVVFTYLSAVHRAEAAQGPAMRDSKPAWFVLKRPLNRNERFNLSQAISHSISLH